MLISLALRRKDDDDALKVLYSHELSKIGTPTYFCNHWSPLRM